MEKSINITEMKENAAATIAVARKDIKPVNAVAYSTLVWGLKGLFTFDDWKDILEMAKKIEY